MTKFPECNVMFQYIDCILNETVPFICTFSFLQTLLCLIILFYCSPKAVLEILKFISVLKSPASNLVSGFPGIPAPEESPIILYLCIKKKELDFKQATPPWNCAYMMKSSYAFPLLINPLLTRPTLCCVLLKALENVENIVIIPALIHIISLVPHPIFHGSTWTFSGVFPCLCYTHMWNFPLLSRRIQFSEITLKKTPQKASNWRLLSQTTNLKKEVCSAFPNKFYLVCILHLHVLQLLAELKPHLSKHPKGSDSFPVWNMLIK